MPKPRPVHPSDFEALTRLWHDGWHEAHSAHVPAELTQKRTLESFSARLENFGNLSRVAGPIGKPIGLCTIRQDELDQLFVAPESRGTGIAAALLADGEARLLADGVNRAHLLCVVQNETAARFYSRQGWENCGVRNEAVFTADGPFRFDVFRFEKDLDC